MTYSGHIHNGVIVPDEPVEMDEGTAVLFEITLKSDPHAPGREECPQKPSLTQVLSRFAGKAQTLPEDAAENLDHYLYGAPKR